MAKLFKEPFVRFLLLGLLLFIGNGIWERHVKKSDHTIIVDTAEMERQAVIFASENRRQPSDEDLQALLFAYVEEEVLVREAQRMGLGENDTIIRRRLAQKMRFLIEDTGTLNLPDESELENWFNDNRAQFVEPERRQFKHIYLSPEKHGNNLQTDAQSLLGDVNDENWKSLGDPFMLNREFENVDQTAIERLFGQQFAKSLFSLDGSSWQGPIESAFGLHIVRIEKTVPERQPDFAEVRPSVERSWRDKMRRTQNNDRLKELISKYEVVVEDTK